MAKRKMTDIIFAAVFLAAATGILIFSVNGERGRLSELSISQEQFLGSDGTVYDLRDDKNGKDWLRQISPEGRLLNHIAFDKKGSDVSTRREIIDVADDIVYLYEFSYQEAGYIARSECIVSYNMKSKKKELLWETQNPRHADERHISKRIWDNKVYIGYLTLADHDILDISVVDINGGTAENYLSTTLPMPYTAFQADSTGSVYFMSPDSTIWQYNGDWNNIFESDKNSSISNISAGRNGDIYALVAGVEKNILYKKEAGSNEFVAFQEPGDEAVTIQAYNQRTLLYSSINENYERYFHLSINGLTSSFYYLLVPLGLVWSPGLIGGILLKAGAAAVILLLARHMVLRKRIKLILKQVLVTVPVFALSVYFIINSLSTLLTKQIYKTVYEELIFLATDEVEEIDLSRFAAIDWANPFNDKYYLELRDKLAFDSLQRYISWNDCDINTAVESNYFSDYWLFRVEDNRALVACCSDNYVNLEARYIDKDQRYRMINFVLENRLPATGLTYSSSGGYWCNAFYPILDEKGIVGILEVGRPAALTKSLIDKLMTVIIGLMIIVLGLLLLSYVTVLHFSLRALGRLEAGAKKLAGGSYDTRVNVNTTDETADIAAAFNKMAESVQKSDLGLRALKDSYSYFVPSEMLGIIGKNSIADILPGDYAHWNAVYLVLSTDSFDSYKNNEFFKALNEFYSCIIPPVLRGGGVIERYNGRGMAAIFDTSAKQAVDTLISMYSALDKLNISLNAAGKKEVECSVFLSRLESLLGVIGSEKRMNMIAMSKLSYESEQIGKMCKRYGCRAILTQAAYEGLGSGASYRSRLLGYIQSEGIKTPVYDFYDCEVPEIMRCKDETKEIFEAGVINYYAGEYSAAKRYFIEVIKLSPMDAAARVYLKESHVRMEEGSIPGVMLKI